MANVDFTKALQDYKNSQTLGQQSYRRYGNAGPGTAIAQALAGYLSGKGMNQAQHRMGVADQAEQDERSLDMARILGAYREDTPYNQSDDETFPGQPPIQGLTNEGTGQNVNAMAQAMMGAQGKELNAAGLALAAREPEDDTDKKIRQYNQAKAGGLIPDDMNFTDFAKITVPSTNITVGGAFKVPTGHKLNPNKGKVDTETGEIDSRDVVPLTGSKTEREYNKPTATQSTASNYASRMIQDEKILGGLTGEGYDPTQISEYIADKFGTWGNFAKTNEGQQYRQAQEDWVRAKLRKESGAVIADEEMEREIKVYFPQPGDGSAVLAQKELQRMIATNGMIKEASIAFEGEPYDVPDEIKYIGGVRYLKRKGKWFTE